MSGKDAAIPYAEVIGTPIAHSRSPDIHNHWLSRLSLPGRYTATHVMPAELRDYFAARRHDEAWRGCNVTIPHKETVALLVDELDAKASAVGAVNTVLRQSDGSLLGTNTDVDGILEALPEQYLSDASEVCVIGSGGAARAALAACKARGISYIILVARNEEAAGALLREFEFGEDAVVRSIAEEDDMITSDIVINATPLGMTGSPPMPQAVLKDLAGALPETVVFDMVYSPLRTELLQAAERAGCTTIDGLAMLIGQAATAFERFYGKSAPRGAEADAEIRRMLTA
jgi:shikimate dehydrogenase